MVDSTARTFTCLRGGPRHLHPPGDLFVESPTPYGGVFSIAINRFLVHDAWAIASHIALSVLTSLFPFLILMTALASLFGAGSLADEATDLILEAWPREVAEPIAGEIHTILTGRRSDVLTSALSWPCTSRPARSRPCGWASTAPTEFARPGTGG